jgi:FkbM family methyltransferase
MKTVTYVDIGLHRNADEIDMMIHVCQKLQCKLVVHGIEAHPGYISKLREKYANFPNVHIHCYAIADKPGVAKLYLSPGSDYHGNSIFRDKNNVTDHYVDTVQMPLSQLIDNGTIKLTEINVLRCNIEGAEYLLYKDLISNQMRHLFQLHCGAPSDMHKVAGLKHLQNTYLSTLKAYGIDHFLFFNHMIPEEKKYMLNQMKQKIKDLLK